MFCPKCGNQLPAESKFCNNCGHSLQAQQTTAHIPIAPAPHVPVPPVAPVVPVPASQPVYVQPVAVPVAMPKRRRTIPSAPTAYTRALTKGGSSILFLITALLFLFQFVFAAYDSYRGLGILHLDAVPARITFHIYHAIDLLPKLLMLIGLLVIFGTCHTKGPQVSAGGFRCMKAAMILRIVFSAILYAVFLIVFLVSLIDDGFDEAMVLQMSVLTLLFAFNFVYLGITIGALSAAIDIGQWGDTRRNCPFFLALLSFLIALGGLWVHFFSPYSFSPSSTTQVLLSAGTQILFGIILLIFRSRIRKANEE